MADETTAPRKRVTVAVEPAVLSWLRSGEFRVALAGDQALGGLVLMGAVLAKLIIRASSTEEPR